MEAKQLRIGNYAFTYKPEMFGIIKAISANETVYLEVGSISYPNLPANKLMPILLTPEILEKCGFIKDEDGCMLFGEIFYWLNAGILQIAMGYTPLINAPCKYIHQLQNLYFSLTGEELEVKL